MTLLDELKATEDSLRGIRASYSGHNFGKSKVSNDRRPPRSKAKAEPTVPKKRVRKSKYD